MQGVGARVAALHPGRPRRSPEALEVGQLDGVPSLGLGDRSARGASDDPGARLDPHDEAAVVLAAQLEEVDVAEASEQVAEARKFPKHGGFSCLQV